MNRDDIIRMAREAGLGDGLITGKSVDGESGIWINLMSVRGVLERFAELVAAAEREACVKIATSMAQEIDDTIGSDGTAAYMEKSIRARGKK